MPPGASSFSASDSSSQEVVCPLRNQDGSPCRKRCLGEKRYRSMQEHIRRAHPEYYIAKLPATKESFELMINSAPRERPAQDPNRPAQNNHHLQQPQQHQQPQHQQQQQHSHHISQPQQPHHQHHHSDPSGLSPHYILNTGPNSSFQGYHTLGGHDGGYFTAGDTEAAAIFNSMMAQQRSPDEYRRGSMIPTVSAAAALAQLQHHRRPDPDWGGDIEQNYFADNTDHLKQNPFHVDPTLEDGDFMADHAGFPASSAQDQPSLQPSSLDKSPPDRSTTLPPLQRSFSRGTPLNRPRKSSLSHQARLGKHERKKSRDLVKRHSGEKKTFGNENSSPAFMYGKRWEDLIDAAASATEEEGSRDLTPIPASPYQSPQVGPRTSLPPFNLASQFHSFQASPLNRALTPPPADAAGLDLQTFPSVESSLSSNLSHHQHHDSAGSGSQFQIMNPSSIDSSSPIFTAGNSNTSHVQIYCAGCRCLSVLKDSFACTACICGMCAACVTALEESLRRRGVVIICPKCHNMHASFKPFQLDLR